jgi:hypothetical protein
MSSSPAIERRHVRPDHFAGVAKGTTSGGHTREAPLFDQFEEA